MPAHDRSPLLGNNDDDDVPSCPAGLKRGILIFIFALLLGFMCFKSTQNLEGSLYDPKERERIRHEWAREKYQVEKDLESLREQHQHEIDQFQDTLAELRREQQHEVDLFQDTLEALREQHQHEIDQFQDTLAELRREQQHEVDLFQDTLAELRLEQQHDIDAYRYALNQIRLTQEREIHEHHATMKRLDQEKEAMQRAWHSDHIKLVRLRRSIQYEEEKIEEGRRELLEERRRWEQERQKREDEDRERQRRLIKWGPLVSDDEPCVRYGTARYSAPLEYAPISWDPYTACMETPLRIHQKDVLPTECLHDGGQMMGIWYIDFDESSCKPWWGETKDDGCVGRQSGIHRYEAHLEGYLNDSNDFKSNWAEMCNTTPQIMFGHTFNSPSKCAYSSRRGVYGLWDVPDTTCN
ncbi:hypothetical protein Agabi119p4_1585 [Agaricus bisporus var. burnettii]|uniref:Uncharacterized protein n=1 Tax=Agaricus bisporus var. burnettii TaxID=192524 RepID=A0A8H7F7K4_AGABI|nr:hypothetical protein Agabi119p4_1585 [Agaricus bisporus var. burnettii]